MREYASGGALIGKKLAEDIGLNFYDKEAIQIVAKQNGLSAEYVESIGQRRGFFFYDTYGFTGDLPMPEQIFIAESNAIKELAKTGSSVFVGRNAGYVLRDDENIINIFIHAPIEWRIALAREKYNLKDVSDIRDYIEKQDKSRRYYNRFFTNQKWGKPQDYNLTIDSSIGIEASTEVIREYVEKFLKTKDGSFVA
jgi:cytidylate kinase